MPVGMRNMAKVSDPTMRPSKRAMNKVDASDSTSFFNASRLGGGFDDDSCGISTSNAATTSSSTVEQISMLTATVTSLGNRPSTVAS